MPAIPVHHTDTATDSWDGPAAEKNCPAEKAALRESHAWVDPNGDPATKSAYRFVHHNISADGTVGPANVKACQSRIGVLNGAMGGTTIPDADRKAVYRHLSMHLKDADIEPPELKLRPTNIEHKELRLEVKQLNEDGTFEGLLATYGNVDLGGDVIEPGAFTKTLKDSGGQIPMLWQHLVEEPIGSFTLTDTPEGLAVKGTLDLNVQRAREAYSLLKKRIIKGLSIGWDSIKETVEGGVRHLKEIRLWEGSVVTFPMNLRAVITSVKAAREAKQADDFTSELQEIQLYAARWQMMQALCCTLESTLYDQGMSADDKVSASQASIQQFQAAYVALLPDYLALMSEDAGGMMGMEMMRAPAFEQKAGRILSAANRSIIDQCITDLNDVLAAGFVTAATRTTVEKTISDLKALLAAADASVAAEAAAKSVTPGTSTEAAETANPGTSQEAAAEPSEPGKSHSAESDDDKILAAFETTFESIRSLIPA